MKEKVNSIKTKIRKYTAGIIFVSVLVIVILVVELSDEFREMAPPVEFEQVNFGTHSWLVLERQGDRMLLLSEYILFEMAYANRRGSNTWEDSSLREYLNHDFIYTFTPEERALIIPVINENPNNPRFNTDGGSDTEDLMFILSLEEVLKYFGDSGERRRRGALINDIYNARRIAPDINGNCDRAAWWVRTPGSGNMRVVRVNQWGMGSARGSISISGDNSSLWLEGTTSTSSDVGVRPAMWVVVDGF